MQIFVDGHLAVLKKNTSFDLVSENSLFTGSDSYSMTITFPLKNCAPNMGIFGWITRKDVDVEKIILDCEIRDKSFNKSGCITITEINEVEVKAQFLEGRSASNFDDSFDTIYINELNLGYCQTRDVNNITPAQAWGHYPNRNEVALPWVNNTSGNIQNNVKMENNAWQWDTTQQLTFQPYLIYIMKKICEAVNYGYDFSEIEASEMKYLLICNTLPAPWGLWNYACALPHWTLTEFWEEIEKLLFGEVVINHRAKSIVFHFHKTVMANKEAVNINNVVNAFTQNISYDRDCDYVKLKNVKYADNDNRYWAYRSCEWYIRQHAAEAMVFATLAELKTFAQTLKKSGVYEGGSRTGGLYTRGYERGSDGHKLFYAQDVDMYFIMFCYNSTLVKTTYIRDEEYHWYEYDNRLEIINEFGMLFYNKDADEIEIKIVPGWIDDTDEEHGQCLFLECGEMGSNVMMEEEEEENQVVTSTGEFGNPNSLTTPDGRTHSSYNSERSSQIIDETDYNDGAYAQGMAGKTIEKGEQESSDEYFDRIYVGYWDGYNMNPGKFPFPYTHTIKMRNDFTQANYNNTLSLYRKTQYYDRSVVPMIDGKKKYTFSWLSTFIPDPRSVFFIWGKKYMCEKITAQFTEKGMSQLLKGVFYRINGPVMVYYSVKATLTHITANVPQLVDAGSSLSIQLTADEGSYLIDESVVVLMGGEPVPGAYADGFITIENVTGNVSITANAVEVIVFEDANVKAICVDNWGGNVISGEITPAEAAAVTTLSNKFYGKTNITKFNELRYFTGLTTLYYTTVSSYSAGAFYNCSALTEITMPAAPITNLNGAFRGSAIKEIDLRPITAASTSMGTTFRDSKVEVITLDAIKYTGNLYYTFRFANSTAALLHTIHANGADFSDATLQSNTFANCYKLQTIDGTITGLKQNLTMSQSSKLTRASLLVIINGLYDFIGAGSSTRRTLTLHATAYARLTADDIAIATAKGWTVASA